MAAKKKIIAKKKIKKTKQKRKRLKTITTKAWAKSVGTGGGRVFGSVSKSTLEIRKRLEELDCDPLEYAVKFLNGTEQPQTHPFFSPFNKFLYALSVLKNRLAKCKSDDSLYFVLEKMQDLMQDIQVMSKTMLGPNTWLDPKVRARIATDLLTYIYPKQQAVHHQGNEVDGNLLVDELTDQQLILIGIKVLEKKKGKTELEDLRGQLLNFDGGGDEGV